jgi:hypothetical protein
MYNLVQAQEALQGMPLNDVMKYANTQNAQVPAYLALAELNRRKQLEDTSAQFYGNPQTVKQQIESAVTKAPQGVNPTQAPQMVNPTARPQGINPAALPPQLAPDVPVPTNPGAAPPAPPMQAAHGGLMSLPLPHMFRPDSYAHGGIVAFDGGGFPPDQSDLKTESPGYGFSFSNLSEFLSAMNPNETEWQKAARYKKNQIQYTPPEGHTSQGLPRPPVKVDPNVSDREDAEAGAAMRALAESNRPPSGKPPSTAKPPAAPAAPPMPSLATKIPEAENLTDEELYERQKKLQRLAGVSEDPYADYKKRLNAIEAKRAQEAEGDALRGIASSLRGFATAAPEKGFGYAAAMGSEAGEKFDRETAALRDKQAMEMADLNKNMAKEEDARRRGDVAGVEAARAAQVKNRHDLAKLQIEQQTANAQTKQAEASWYHATHPQPNQITSFEQLYNRNPELAKLYLGQGKTGTMTLEEAFKSVQNDPLAASMTEDQKRALAMERYRWASGQGGGQLAPGTIKDGYRFKGGNPADKNNWEKV